MPPLSVVRAVSGLIAAIAVAGSTYGGDGACLAAAAREQVGVTTIYDGRYLRLAYPGGDLPIARGVCTDVLVRAYRRLGLDLQVLVHEDMGRAWDAYPKRWGLSGPDPNIDHRRVLNLVTFFARHGQSLPVSRDPAAWEAGDLVAWRLPSGLPHIGIVSDRRTVGGVPLVVHNIGAGTVEDDVLFGFTLTAHLRYLPEPAATACRREAEAR
ncbi:MAG: DUF1287 domain-containing protein [Acidobacteria bacterium]|nr:DUF1287 domain-containing protein [Acidobacteriota bacterium]